MYDPSGLLEDFRYELRKGSIGGGSWYDNVPADSTSQNLDTVVQLSTGWATAWNILRSLVLLSDSGMGPESTVSSLTLTGLWSAHFHELSYLPLLAYKNQHQLTQWSQSLKSVWWGVPNLTFVNKEVVQLLDTLDRLSLAIVGTTSTNRGTSSPALVINWMLVDWRYWVLRSLQMQRSTWLQFHMEMCVVDLLVSVR